MKSNELLDDYFFNISSGIIDCIVPDFLPVIIGFKYRLPFTAGRHQGLHHAGQSDEIDGFIKFFKLGGIKVLGGS